MPPLLTLDVPFTLPILLTSLLLAAWQHSVKPPKSMALPTAKSGDEEERRRGRRRPRIARIAQR